MFRRILFFLTVIVLSLFTTTAFAGVIELPRTGQTKCYDFAGAEISCVDTGQDGEYRAGVAWPSPRFSTNADTTVTDNLTGLVWALDGNLMISRDRGWDQDGTIDNGAVTWQHALDYVAKLNAENYLGYWDWRLPNFIELESLFHAGYNEENCGGSACLTNAVWLNTQGFTSVQSSYPYWSSTTYAPDTNKAWFVRMGAGTTDERIKGFSAYVWPVRSGQTGIVQLPKTGQTISYAIGDDGDLEMGVACPEPRFTDNGDGTVTDNLTGLMWLTDANCMQEKYPDFDKDKVIEEAEGDGKVTRQRALDFVKGINNDETYSGCGGGYTDWRLANRKELKSLADYSKFNPNLPEGHPFTNVPPSKSDYYWMSTAYPSTSAAWVSGMWCGCIGGYDKELTRYHVWPVRSGLVQDVAER